MCETLMPVVTDTESQNGYDLLREACGLFKLDDFFYLEVSGEDKKAWLQGQVTNDIRALHPESSLAFNICTATGQLIAFCDAWNLTNRYVISAQRSALTEIKERLSKAIIMEDVTLESLEATHESYTIQGPTATAELGKLMELPTVDACEVEFEGAQVICLRSNRTGLGGWDVLLPVGSKRAVKALRTHFQTVGQLEFDIARLEAGIPVLGQDTNAKTFPPELGSAFQAKTVSYKKGCYTGQEVLMRIYSRGHTNQTWVGLLSHDPIPVGAKLMLNRNEVGVVTSSVDSPRYGYMAGALVKNIAAQDGELLTLVEGEVSTECEVRMMPIMRFE